MNYINISAVLEEKSKLLKFIIISDKLNLDYEMKMLADFTIENISSINEKLSAFYSNTEKRILEIEVLINESINTAC